MDMGKPVDVVLMQRATAWAFPEDRFVAYEASDEPWCRALGIGHEVAVDAFTTIDDAKVQQVDSTDGNVELRLVFPLSAISEYLTTGG